MNLTPTLEEVSIARLRQSHPDLYDRIRVLRRLEVSLREDQRPRAEVRSGTGGTEELAKCTAQNPCCSYDICKDCALALILAGQHHHWRRESSQQRVNEIIDPYVRKILEVQKSLEAREKELEELTSSLEALTVSSPKRKKKVE